MPNRMDSMLSHGMGKVKAVKARFAGLVGVFQKLAEQHGEVTVLLQRAKSSDAKFTELWPTIRKELISHERAEVRELYPLLRIYPQLVALANHHDSEAGQLESLIQRIDALAPSGDRTHLYDRLVKTVLHHAVEEERDIFPKAQHAMGKEQAHAIEAKLLTVKHHIAAGL